MKKTTALAALAIASAFSSTAMADELVTGVLTTYAQMGPQHALSTVVIPNVTLSNCSAIAAAPTVLDERINTTISCIGKSQQYGKGRGRIVETYQCNLGKCTEITLTP